jgi:hypothetical protein
MSGAAGNESGGTNQFPCPWTDVVFIYAQAYYMDFMHSISFLGTLKISQRKKAGAYWISFRTNGGGYSLKRSSGLVSAISARAATSRETVIDNFNFKK